MSTPDERILCVSEVQYPGSPGSCALSPDSQASSWRTKINTLLLLNFPKDREQHVCVFSQQHPLEAAGVEATWLRCWRLQGGEGAPRSPPLLKSLAMENHGDAREKQWLFGVSRQYLLKPKMNDVILLLLPALKTRFVNMATLLTFMKN